MEGKGLRGFWTLGSQTEDCPVTAQREVPSPGQDRPKHQARLCLPVWVCRLCRSEILTSIVLCVCPVLPRPEAGAHEFPFTESNFPVLTALRHVHSRAATLTQGL